MHRTRSSRAGDAFGQQFLGRADLLIEAGDIEDAFDLRREKFFHIGGQRFDPVAAQHRAE